MTALPSLPGRSHARVTAVSWAALLVLSLCWGATAVEAHSRIREAVFPAAGLEDAPAPVEQKATGPTTDALATGLVPAPPTSRDWTWVVWLIPPAMAAARRLRSPRGLALTVALALAVFACESSVHAVHHLKNPSQAERCPVYSASQQVSGLSAAPATPDLPPPSPVPGRPEARSVPLLSRALDGEQSRAPPVLPA
jgi:hypothetical protein